MVVAHPDRFTSLAMTVVRSASISATDTSQFLRCHHPRRRVIQYSRGLLFTETPRRTGSSAFADDDHNITAASFRMAMRLRSRGLIRPSFARFAPLKAEGAGKAGCWPHPWSACNKKARGRTTGTSRTSGLPCAMVLTAAPCSPRGPGCLAPVIGIVADQTPASGCRDHTS